jgi:hypothetical protein
MATSKAAHFGSGYYEHSLLSNWLCLFKEKGEWQILLEKQYLKKVYPRSR